MENKGKVVLYWCGGVILASLTALVIGLYLVALMFGIQPETLANLIGTWLAVSFIIAFTPLLMVVLGVADDCTIRYFAETGVQIAKYGNPVGWLYCLWTRVVK